MSIETTSREDATSVDAGSGSEPPSSNASDRAPCRRSRWRRWLRRALIALVVLAVLFGIALWLLQPQRSVPVLLDRGGQALGLVVTAAPDVEARLRDTPQLVVRDLVVREPDSKAVILRADRLLIALPWSTLRSRGDDLTVERLELDAPVLDLVALQTWLAKRPPSEETTIPTLTDGLRVRDGRIDNDDWHIENVAVDLPALHAQRPVEARIRGRYVDAPTAIPFDLAVALTRPANGAGLAVVGPLAIERGDDWRIPATVTFSGPLRIGQDDLRIEPVRFGMIARYEAGETTLPFTLGLFGPLHFDNATWALEPVTASLRSDGPIPNFDANGAFAIGRRLVLRLDGRMPAWPEAWPALPAPIGASRSPLPFRLDYVGAPDLSETIGLDLARDAMRFESRFRLNDTLAWISAREGSPLPPLDGRLRAPRLEISGATLEGVEVEIDDEAVK